MSKMKLIKHLSVFCLYLTAGLNITLAQIVQTTNTAKWEQISTKKESGHAITVDPKNTKTIYIGLRPTGIYKTTDGGKNWKVSNQGINIKKVPQNGISANDIFIHPLDRKTIYVGLEWNGVFKSNDAGENWIECNSGLVPGGGFNGVTFGFHPKKREIIYLGTDAGLYKTDDGGKNWVLKKGLPVQTVSYIVIDFKNPQILYAAVYVPVKNGEAGVWKSLDGGETWKPMNNGLPQGSVFDNPKLPYQPKNGTHGILMNPQDSKNLVAGTSGGIYVTFNGGETWNQSTGTPSKITRTMSMTNHKRPTIYAFIYQNGAFRSDDFGKSWKFVPNTNSQRMLWRIKADPKNSNLIYGAGGDGILRFLVD